jgi:Zn-dependent peptidase ImmA (M78 family)
MDKIKIGAVSYKVLFVENPTKRDGGAIDGQIDHGWAEILIKKNMDKQIQVQTILHEILHAIEAQSGRPHELKEPMVDALAFGIYQALRDNPQLVKLITK